MIRPLLSNFYEVKFKFSVMLEGISILLIAESITQPLRNFNIKDPQKNSKIM